MPDKKDFERFEGRKRKLKLKQNGALFRNMREESSSRK